MCVCVWTTTLAYRLPPGVSVEKKKKVPPPFLISPGGFGFRRKKNSLPGGENSGDYGIRPLSSLGWHSRLSAYHPSEVAIEIIRTRRTQPPGLVVALLLGVQIRTWAIGALLGD